MKGKFEFTGNGGEFFSLILVQGLLTLITFMIYGAVMVIPALEQVNWQVLLYAVLSLTIVRIIPVALSLIGMGLRIETLLFLGWFGPRGIASIIYGLILVEEVALPGREIIFSIMIVTVLLSVFAHGLTAVPAANAYGAHAETMKDEPDLPEMKQVGEMPVRVSYQE